MEFKLDPTSCLGWSNFKRSKESFFSWVHFVLYKDLFWKVVETERRKVYKQRCEVNCLEIWYIDWRKSDIEKKKKRNKYYNKKKKMEINKDRKKEEKMIFIVLEMKILCWVEIKKE